MYVPGLKAGVYDKLTAAVDVMPTVMQILDQPVPEHVEGDSLLPGCTICRCRVGSL